MKELIKELSNAFGPSGLEDRVADIIVNKLRDICDTVEITPMHAVVGVIKGNGGRKRMISCGMDETTFIINEIDGEGFIKMKSVSNYDGRAISGRTVTVGNETTLIDGIMSGKVLHLSSGDDTAKPSLDKMFVDIGKNSADELKGIIEVGDFVTFKGEFSEFGKNKIVGKAFDSRVACAIAIKVAENYKKSGKTPDGDLIFAFNAREKAGKTTAVSVCNRYNPDSAMIISSYSASAVKDEKNLDCYLGEGPVLVSHDDNALYFGAPQYKNAISYAKENDVKIQIPSQYGIHNPSAKLELSGSGVNVINLSLPCLNIRSQHEIMSKKDIESALLLAECYINEKI